MSIGLQAYLQGYMHEKAAVGPPPLGSEWLKSQEERQVKDRQTAKNRARTTGKLQASGENKGRQPAVRSRWGEIADILYRGALHVSRPARQVADFYAPWVKRSIALGKEGDPPSWFQEHQDRVLKE